MIAPASRRKAAFFLCAVVALAATRSPLPYTCAQVRYAVYWLGSLQAAERYANERGIRFTPHQRRQARACLRGA